MSTTEAEPVAVHGIQETDARLDADVHARPEKPILSVVDHPFHHFHVKGDSRQYNIIFPPKILALATSSNAGAGDDDDIGRVVYCDQCSERLDNFGERLGLESSDQIPDDHNPLVRRLYLRGCAEEGISPNNGVLQKFAPGLPCILGQTGIAFTHCFIGEAGFSPVLSVMTLMQNLQRVDLSSMGLRDSSIVELVQLFEKRDGVNIIDLSTNHIGNRSFDLLLGLLIKAPAIFRLYVDQTDMDKTRQLVLDLETYTHRCARPAEYEKARRLAIAENPRWIREKNDELFTTSMGHLVPIPFCKPLVAGKERDVLHDFRLRSVTSPRSPTSPGRHTLSPTAAWGDRDSDAGADAAPRSVAAARRGRLPAPELAPLDATRPSSAGAANAFRPGGFGVRWSGTQPRPPRKEDRDEFEEKVRPSMWGQFVARRWWEERKRLMRGKRSGKSRSAAVNPLLVVAAKDPFASSGAVIRKMASAHLGPNMDELGEFDEE